MSKISKIIGPPGTGKTTAIMQYIEAAAKKFDRERIGAISFTKAAVENLADRIRDDKGEVPSNIRTIHSHAFRLLGLKKEQVCDNSRNNKRLKGFCDAYPRWELSASRVSGDDDNFSYDYHTKDNDQLFQEMQILRHQMVPEDRWPENTQALYRDWMSYLRENDFIDFTGILEKCYRLRMAPRTDVLFIDEAQDLTLLQYVLVRMWAERNEHALFVGDSDQVLYRWGGVQPEVFMGIDHEWFKLLDQSYRVPRNILEYALRIIRNVSNREDITYKPDTRYGDGEVITDATEPDLSLPGTHMILTRCNYQVRRWMNYLRDNNIVWHNPYRLKDHLWNPTTTKAWLAYEVFYNLTHGQSVTGYKIQLMAGNMLSKGTMARGLKAQIANWTPDELARKYNLIDLALLGFTTMFLDGQIPLRDWISKDSKITDSLEDLFTPAKPRCVVGTIHSVKGGEADHVWIDSESTARICDDINQGVGAAYDDEARLYYVAATRARKTLGIIQSKSRLRAPFIC